MPRELCRCLAEGALDDALARLYGAGHLEDAKTRCAGVAAGFVKSFGGEAEALFSAPGRTELGGNHTDHQHGRVLAAGINLDILAAAAPNRSGMIRLQSQGYPPIAVDLSRLTPQPEETGTSAALIRGIAARFAALGCPVKDAGLDACVVSNVPGGSGLSSSAAFEVLVAMMLNEFFHGGKCDPVELAQIGQYAENVYFGKPCGLMDQTASSVGGVVAIDFQNPASPMVDRIFLDLAAHGYALCLVDSGAGHAALTAEYAAITDELRAVSRCFDKQVLREVPEADFLAALPQVRRAAGDRGVLRAFHFYGENARTAQQAQALRAQDFDRFLTLVRQSGYSSALYLQNITPAGQTVHQEMMLTLALCERILRGRGAVRVHGGGFGGAAQALVPLDMIDAFKKQTEAVLGEGACHVLTIRNFGGVILSPNRGRLKME